ncbi:histidinol dehydrogenase [Salinicoccus halodurans]|uniref:histidinol dehydrogenase n=1 Tax=Salinicoccus halodurans TaxID=407035 RepID=A0A0F7HN99_9STAP|nr:histidinol dehydrogenase [Salinicoccus halodurans]AKG75112.1 histidinol dehydrogenase [Salinicoccus halodurans]SFK65948.1 histidinol dehydrogenase [Salinicoccus halodurans]
MKASEFREVFQNNTETAGFEGMGDVMAIIEEVRQNKDAALRQYTEKFDGRSPASFQVPAEHLEESYNALPEAEKQALEKIRERIESYQKTIRYQNRDDGEFKYVYHPLEKVGVYVPGGTALYPSSVLMTVVPALVAGVDEIHVVTPTFEENNITFAALHICGVKNVYTVGGAHAIAALAYGTESIPKVDKIVGPGNYYVALAKRLLFGEVGIDMIAGPSEILIYIDSDVNVDAIVYDIFAQSEHDANARTFLLSENQEIIDTIKSRINMLIDSQPRVEIIKKSLENNHYAVVDSREQLLELINHIAPEHVSIQHKDSEMIIRNIKYAGAVFEGYYSPEAIGDYAAGPSHVLPTDRTGRFSHGLNVNDFLTSHAVISLEESTFDDIAEPAMAVARREQLDAHYQSLKIRTE